VKGEIQLGRKSKWVRETLLYKWFIFILLHIHHMNWENMKAKSSGETSEDESTQCMCIKLGELSASCILYPLGSMNTQQERHLPWTELFITGCWLHGEWLPWYISNEKQNESHTMYGHLLPLIGLTCMLFLVTFLIHTLFLTDIRSNGSIRAKSEVIASVYMFPWVATVHNVYQQRVKQATKFLAYLQSYLVSRIETLCSTWYDSWRYREPR